MFFLFGLKGWVHGDAGLTMVERTMDFGLLKGEIGLGSDSKLMQDNLGFPSRLVLLMNLRHPT